MNQRSRALAVSPNRSQPNALGSTGKTARQELSPGREVDGTLLDVANQLRNRLGERLLGMR